MAWKRCRSVRHGLAVAQVRLEWVARPRVLIRPTRRGLVAGLTATALLGGAGTAAYGLAIEPIFRLEVTPYAFTPPGWPAGLHLTAVILADFHAGEPEMSPERIAEIVAVANALRPDVVFLLGDYEPGHPFHTRAVPMKRLAKEVAALSAPLGVHAVLGNHDWWADFALLKAGGTPASARALRDQGIRVLENDAVRLVKDGQPFWVAGLADQMAQHPLGLRRGYDDLPGTLARVTDDAPVLLLAHEPFVIRKVPRRVALTISGHTHGGQVRLFGRSPVMRSPFESRYLYGHVVDATPEGERHILISGGLGTSKFPVRIGSPPEVVVLKLGAPPAIA